MSITINQATTTTILANGGEYALCQWKEEDLDCGVVVERYEMLYNPIDGEPEDYKRIEGGLGTPDPFEIIAEHAERTAAKVTVKQPRTLAQLAQEAINVQDACNLSGVVHSFAENISELREHVKGGTHQINTHPICILFISKMADLAGCSSAVDSATVYMALDDCRRLVIE